MSGMTGTETSDQVAETDSDLLTPPAGYTPPSS
jgi:hypothetical protein